MPQTIDITEFVKASRQQLIDAIGASGVPEAKLREVCHKTAPFGSYKLPVIIFMGSQPIAKYFLTYPTKDGQKSVKFNVQTYQEIQKWLTPNLLPSPSSMTGSPSSS